jgi:hypothetical protein
MSARPLLGPRDARFAMAKGGVSPALGEMLASRPKGARRDVSFTRSLRSRMQL